MKNNNFFERTIRLIRFIFWIFKVLWVGRFFADDPLSNNGHARIAKILQEGLDILNIRIHTDGSLPESLQQTVVVSNHVSWLDPLLLLTRYPLCFVAKKEIKQWFLLGKIVENTGHIFIDRENKRASNAINQKLVSHLNNQANVAFFPEARTSKDGFNLLPFKAALFESALISQANIQAIAIRYYDCKQQRTIIPAYIDNVSLFQSLRQILRQKKIIAHLSFIPIIKPDATDRFALKDKVEQQIAQIINIDIPKESQCP
ncbi:MAG: 1-acyl-sn-glycerol-3-phosphate acyltransferase [Neisseriaceae bacterium]|nr:1-acyl-sn-glycerol-3-phosphate acyltransferase [Neisseriaceae bacterium]